jgi:hypothetical protein
MRERASRGYCVDAAKNAQLLSQEVNRLKVSPLTLQSDKDKDTEQYLQSLSSLCRLWTWVARVETLDSVTATQDDQITIDSCGILSTITGKIVDNPLSNDLKAIPSESIRLKSLGIDHYYSPERYFYVIVIFSTMR